VIVFLTTFLLRRLLHRYRPSTLALLGLAVGLAVAAIRRPSLRDELAARDCAAPPIRGLARRLDVDLSS
jgi:hypothetical protein